MKVVLNILCWVLVAFCIYFPCAYFNNNADRQEVKVSHILVNTEEEAINLKKQIDENPKSFEKLAQENSLCNSKEQKGDIGYVLKGKLYLELEKVAFEIEKNKVSEPIQTKEGWHLIKVTDVKNYSDLNNFSRRYF